MAMTLPPPIRRPRPSFTPRFTVSLIYLFGFFFLFCLLLVAPALYEVAQTLPPGPEQEEAAKQASKAAIQPRLAIAIVASVVTTTLGAHFKLLPGLRERG